MGSITNSLAACKDEVIWLPLLYKPVPPKAAWKRFTHLLALNPVGLEANGFLEVPESLFFRSVVNGDFFVVVPMFLKPVVHFTRYRWRLALVAAAYNLDPSLI